MTSLVGDSVHVSGGSEPGWWNIDGTADAILYGAWQAKGMPDVSSTQVDLSGAGKNLVPDPLGGAPGWNATDGWVFIREVHHCWNTPDTIASTYTITCRYTNHLYGCMMGAEGSSANGIYLYRGNSVLCRFVLGNYNSYGAYDYASGVVSLVGSPGRKGYTDGVEVISGLTQYTVGDTGYPCGIGGFYDSTGIYDMEGEIQAACIHTDNLTGPQITQLHAQMALL